MKCRLVVGQQVVLVDDFSPEQRRSAPTDKIILPELDVVYTVRNIGVFEDEPIILLAEIVNTPRYYADVLGVTEQGFRASRFAPVAKQNTDIGVFKAMLQASKSTVPA